MDILPGVLAALAALLVVAGVWAAATYTALTRVRSLVQEAWRQIDVELHRRHALVPVLVEAVRAYAAAEQEAFTEVTRARDAAAMGGVGPAEQARRENALSSALSRLFAVAEHSPELHSSEGFADLQAELTTTEDRIAAGRRFYNANARRLNAKVEHLPTSAVARLCSFHRAETFEANDPAVRAVPSGHFTPGEAPSSVLQLDGGPAFGGEGAAPRRDA